MNRREIINKTKLIVSHIAQLSTCRKIKVLKKEIFLNSFFQPKPLEERYPLADSQKFLSSLTQLLFLYIFFYLEVQVDLCTNL